ncbi:MAG: hypothetical protein AWU57_514 [Marinobacter sp. T13-3]|nr:MAG: hypothetical protein AWU57_514 [Marinobacter sp. T13-3]
MHKRALVIVIGLVAGAWTTSTFAQTSNVVTDIEQRGSWYRSQDHLTQQVMQVRPTTYSTSSSINAATKLNDNIRPSNAATGDVEMLLRYVDKVCYDYPRLPARWTGDENGAACNRWRRQR